MKQAKNAQQAVNKAWERSSNGQQGELTEVVFILDRSGSMSGLEGDTIGGFNSFIAKQRRLPGEAIVSTVLFDNSIEILHDREPLAGIAQMTEDDYYVRGCTALIDAMGIAIKHIGDIHKKAGRAHVPDHTIFVIITDGEENSSTRYTAREVRRMVRRQKEKYGWEFIFLGANIDAVETAERYGIDRDFVADYHADSAGTSLNYEVLSETVASVRAEGLMCPQFMGKIRDDYKKRGGKK